MTRYNPVGEPEHRDGFQGVHYMVQWQADEIARADDGWITDDTLTRDEVNRQTHRWLCAMLIAIGMAGSILGAMALESAWTAYNAERIAEEME